jgi:hypothetical protein
LAQGFLSLGSCSKEPKSGEFPVIYPVSKELGLGDRFRQTASTTIFFNDLGDVRLVGEKMISTNFP